MHTKTIEGAAFIALAVFVLAVIVAVKPTPPKMQLHCHDGSCHAHGGR